MKRFTSSGEENCVGGVFFFNFRKSRIITPTIFGDERDVEGKKRQGESLTKFSLFLLLFSPSFFPAPLPALNEAKYCKAEECFFELNLILGRDSIPALFGLNNQSFCNLQAVFFTTRPKSMCTIVQFTCVVRETINVLPDVTLTRVRCP